MEGDVTHKIQNEKVFYFLCAALIPFQFEVLSLLLLEKMFVIVSFVPMHCHILDIHCVCLVLILVNVNSLRQWKEKRQQPNQASK